MPWNEGGSGGGQWGKRDYLARPGVGCDNPARHPVSDVRRAPLTAGPRDVVARAVRAVVTAGVWSDTASAWRGGPPVITPIVTSLRR